MARLDYNVGKFPTLPGSYNSPVYRPCTGGQDNPATADYRAYADKISGSLFSDQKAFWSWINKTKRCRHPIPPVLHDGSLYFLLKP